MRYVWINKGYIAKIASTITGGFYALLGFIGTLVPLDEILSDKMSIWIRGIISATILIGIWGFCFVAVSIHMTRKNRFKVLSANNGHALYLQYGNDITADELLAGTDTAKTESKTAQAQMLILELLADGKRMPSAELEKAVNERGISSRTMRTAKSRIGDRLVTEKDGTACMIAVFNGDKGGTANTLHYAESKGLNIVIINPNDLSRDEKPLYRGLKLLK